MTEQLRHLDPLIILAIVRSRADFQKAPWTKALMYVRDCTAHCVAHASSVSCFDFHRDSDLFLLLLLSPLFFLSHYFLFHFHAFFFFFHFLLLFLYFLFNYSFTFTSHISHFFFFLLINPTPLFLFFQSNLRIFEI